MNLAPVVIFTFNRLKHTINTIESLKKNILASESEIFIFSDGARNKKEENKVEEVRKYLKEIDGFKCVNIIEASNNKGLANSVIDGVTEIINIYGKVIVLEDDLVTSKYFLEYMNEGLGVYENRNDIWSLSGYGPSIDIPNEYKNDVYVVKRGSSWGWATWKDRWNLTDWKIENYSEFKNDKKRIKQFNKSGKDLSHMLEDQSKGRIDSWAIRWVYSQFNNNMWTIYPVKSLVKNIGNDLSGTHTGLTDNYNVEITNKKVSFNINIDENKDISKNFKEIYDKNFSGYLALFMKKVGLYKVARRFRNMLIKKLKNKIVG